MNKAPLSLIAIVVDEDASPLTLAELCRACRVSPHDVANWVADGIVEPTGAMHATGHSVVLRCGARWQQRGWRETTM